MNTTYFLNLVAGNVFGSKTSPGIPSKYYLGLSTTTPTIAGGNVTEPAANLGYARVELTSLGQPSSGVITNTQMIDFPESTASWGTVTHFVVYDAATGGNLLMFGALTDSQGHPAPRTVEIDTVMAVRSGALALTTANPA